MTDEGIYVMGAMQLVGFVSVIGALWKVRFSNSLQYVAAKFARKICNIAIKLLGERGSSGEMSVLCNYGFEKYDTYTGRGCKRGLFGRSRRSSTEYEFNWGHQSMLWKLSPLLV